MNIFSWDNFTWGRLQASAKETAINKYNNVQTGPNIQLGGLKLGFASPAYQLAIEGAVRAPPTAATEKQSNKEKASFLADMECFYYFKPN